MASIRKLLVAFPTLPEQQEILYFLNARVAEFDKLVAECSRQINFVREYRTRLIADVVTGKLDVREAAARLPEEIEEPEPLDESEVANDTEEAADDLDAAPEEAEA